jgi:hypothetical protein
MPAGLDTARFTELYGDLQTCKTRVERVLSRKFSRPRDCSTYCLEVLISTSRLYLDSLVFGRALRKSAANGNEAINPLPPSIRRRSCVRELAFREKFSRKVESLACWAAFQPINTFVDENRLRTQEDYLYNLTLHLPEIHGEVVDLAGLVRGRLKTGRLSDADCWRLITGLEHAAHHASYCRHTLEVLSNELSWGLGSALAILGG